MGKESTDEDLFQRYRTRADADAFATLYDRYAAPVHAFLGRFLRNAVAAEDLVQQTFLRVHEARAAFDARLSFRTWIFTIARRLAINFVERERRIGGPTSDEVADRRPTPEEHAISRSELLRLQDALAGLSDDDATIVLLAKFEGLTSEELGQVLDCSADAAKMRLHRALRRLGERLTAGHPETRLAAKG